MDATPPEAESPRTARFEALHPRVGAPVHLAAANGAQQDRLASSLIGFVVGEYMIVRRPVDGRGLLRRLDVGQVLRVSLFTGTEAAAFESSLLRHLGPPIACWHLAYPASVRVQTIRSSPRVVVSIEASVEVAGGSEPTQATICDLSVSGALLHSSQQLAEPDAQIQVSFALPRDNGESAAVSLAATVKSVRKAPTDATTSPGYRHGVQFVKVTPADQAPLERFVAAQSG